MPVYIDGIDGALSMLDRFSEEKISAAVADGAALVAAEARALCPVDTGALRNSIEVSPNGTSASVVAGEDYGVYVEFGTYKMAAKPFMVPALLNNTGAIVSRIAEAFK